MADLENLLLEAAGRTGASGRKQHFRSQSKRRKEGSYSDEGSDSKDNDSDNPGFTSRKPSGSQVPLKKRLDPAEKDDDRGSRGDDDEDNDHDGVSGDDSDSVPSVGSDLYKDDADREALAKMSELEREMILSDRASLRDDYQLKKRVRQLQSEKKIRPGKEQPSPPLVRGRSSVKTDKAKDDALKELRARRLKALDPDGLRKKRDGVGSGGQDASPVRRKPAPVAASSSSDSGSSESGSGSESKSGDEGSTGGGDLAESDDDGPTSETEKLTYKDIKDITIRRSKLAKWFMEPFFEELIVGCFVRVGIGMSRSGQSIYRLCMVRNVDATDRDRQYKLENRITHKYLNCIWGNENSAARWQMARVSDSEPLEKEFDEWKREVQRSQGRMLSRQDVLDKREAIQKINTFVYSAATVKQMLQEKKSASSRPSNIAAEKDRLRKDMDVAESQGKVAEVDRIKAKLQELEAMSRQPKQKDAKAVMLAEMNKRNRAENFRNASDLKPVNTALKIGEAGYDPFSRRWTRSRNYYVSKPAGDEATDEDGVEAALGSGEGGAEVGPAAVASEAGEAATVAALEAAAGAGKLVDTSAPVDKGTESHSLHDFELAISLAGLQKFGGPQGAQLGFLARKQRIEATIGHRVPENDGRRHALTLTVSDYKRRRGLL